MSKSLRGLFFPVAATTAAVTLLHLNACNPYERRSGNYNAGGVDPVNFPAQYLGNADSSRPQFGSAGVGNHPGQGTFQFVQAYAHGQQILYYALPFNGQQGAAMAPDSLDLSMLPGPAPLAYVFDPSQTDTAPDSSQCMAPDGYMYDPERDAVRFDRQGNIFTQLPKDSMPTGKTAYIPIVREVVVHSMGNPCQDAKSEASVVTRNDVQLQLDQPMNPGSSAMPTGHPSGRFIAYAIIDPAADVLYPSGTFPVDMNRLCGASQGDTQHDPTTCLGPQRWGWYQQYLLSYLDGGYIPLATSQPSMTSQVMATQNLYYPTMVFDPNAMMAAPGDLGLGHDLMDYKRGETGYSPICHVWTFDPKDIMNPEKSVGDIMDGMHNVTDTMTYVYCLQTPPSM